MDPQAAPPEAAWVAVPLILLVLFIRLRRAGRDRRLRVEWLWVTPVLLLVVAGLMMTQAPYEDVMAERETIGGKAKEREIDDIMKRK